MKSNKRFAAFAVATLLGCGHATSALAEASYLAGRINDVTFVGDKVLIRIDTGLPTNCSGTSHGFMYIPESSKAAQAFVLGLWLGGNASTTPVTVYTGGVDGTAWCVVGQIDPL